MQMTRSVVTTADAPDPAGPYSQAIHANGLLFCSGQVGADPATGELAGTTVAEQTARCLDNLAAVLSAGGSALDRVVKVNAYLADMNDFAEFNAAYARYFTDAPPARATIGVGALPKGARVEVECIALA
jgi:2-iminobutanoate/2-iminopropanoate deaminase